MPAIYNSLWERLMANTHEPENEQACWVWSGSKDRAGYGKIAVRVPGRASPVGRRAHRLVVEIILGRALDPNEETVEHLCLCTSCINPDHTALVTRAENTSLMRKRNARVDD